MQMPLRLLLTLTARNLWAHRVKSLIVGAILFFGTFLVVLGGSLLSSIQDSMARSITSSMTGHLLVYAADAPDPLAIFGGAGMNTPDHGEIDAFGSVTAPLREVDNVHDIVPMGLTLSTIFGPSELDRVLERLAEAVQTDDRATRAAAEEQVRHIAAQIRDEHAREAASVADKERHAEQAAVLAEVAEPAYWSGTFAADPLGGIDRLESELAPLAGDGRMLFLRMVGTDLTQFADGFDRFYVVDGEPVPEGRRGLLFSKRTYERIIKNKVARDLDAVWEDVDQEGAVIADDPLLQSAIKRLSRQTARVTYGMDAAVAAELEAELSARYPELSGSLDDKLQQFLAVDDTTIADHYAAFYELVAPRIRLYDFPVGTVVPLRAYTRSGYVRSINVRIWGTYEFQGLEKSDLASASNLVDLVTFRDLYGKMSAEQLAELADIKAEVGVADLDRASAEDALFGGGAELVVEVAEGTGADDGLAADGAAEAAATGSPLPTDPGAIEDERVYTTAEMRDGLAIYGAILLRDPDRQEASQLAIQQAIDKHELGLQVVDWQTASGIVGQFLFVAQAILVVALLVIFLVALLIINNSMVLATMDRVGEIGTMRAIGAHRRTVLLLFMGETALLGLLAGSLGALVGAGVVFWLGQVGIPAFQDVLVLLFAGPRLYPTVGLSQVLFGMGSVVVVGVLSTLYPAVLASRVPPVVAMQAKE